MSLPNRYLWSKIELFYRPEWTKGGTTWKWMLSIFQIQKWILQTVRAEKVDEKNGLICVVSMFSFRVMVLKLSKKVYFLQFCSDLSKFVVSLLKQFTYMHLKGLVIHFQKMVLCKLLWLTVSEILGFEVEEFCFYILIANISWTVAQTNIDHIIFWRSVMRTFRCIICDLL